ncbi:MAG: hypothetical protein QM731_21615 [Chitinophagaceae bacterium]
MSTQMIVGLPEIIVFLLGAAGLGFAIHFFIFSRRSMPIAAPEHSVLADSVISEPEADQWRIKYFEQRDAHEAIVQQLNLELDELKGNEELLTLEAEELKKEIAELQTVLENNYTAPSVNEYGDEEESEITEEEPESQEIVLPRQAGYLSQLKNVQESLSEHHHYIAQLLNQVNALRETEQKYAEALLANEALQTDLQEAANSLNAKDLELSQLRGQQLLAGEMKDRLERSYEEFNTLRNRLQKMEFYFMQSRHSNMEYEELQQSHFKLVKDYDELKQRNIGMVEESQRLSRVLTDTEDKLRESNFQRQQLLKKITFLEELSNDLQQIAQHNKKLDNQLKRMSEIEAMLNRVQNRPEQPE